ncbi:hypothetical protein G7K_5033-t1 [Saitoella complicata NRRL Y-17804]|uniref:Uncharacterized protein n=1 Tax=Saitoella complicata (strain BCRC 22490 / CBS 7301 / JCM 7358 / NBRC 10748 / NRRL Y-17804) TaxID=698492 RepID=A0A0E9NM54_SAICN|nr:hypothetical protein G7K_5033-t1 [Saitoella complicata NRRL Y-17804]
MRNCFPDRRHIPSQLGKGTRSSAPIGIPPSHFIALPSLASPSVKLTQQAAGSRQKEEKSHVDEFDDLYVQFVSDTHAFHVASAKSLPSTYHVLNLPGSRLLTSRRYFTLTIDVRCESERNDDHDHDGIVTCLSIRGLRKTVICVTVETSAGLPRKISSGRLARERVGEAARFKVAGDRIIPGILFRDPEQSIRPNGPRGHVRLPERAASKKS